MAKKKRGSGVFRRAEANINALERALRQDRNQDYRLARNQQDAIFGNLAQTTRGQGKKLTAANRRIMGQMERLAAKSQRGIRAVGTAAGQAEDLYGGAMADVVGQEFAGARQTAREGRDLSRAQAAEGARSAQTGRDLVGMAQAGAEEARAGADDARERAMTARTQQDARDIGMMRHEVAMAKLQHQLELERQRKAAQRARRDLQFQQDLAVKAAGQQVGGELNILSSSVAGVSAFARSYLEQNPDASFEEVMERMSSQGYIPEEDMANPAKRHVYESLVRNLMNSNLYGPNQIGGRAGRTAEVNLIMGVLTTSYPEYVEQHRKMLAANVRAVLNTRYTSAAAPQQDSGGTFGPEFGPRKAGLFGI